MTESAHSQTRRRTPIQSLLARWPIAVALALVGLVLGVAAALATPTTYTAEARLAVKAGGLSTGALAGLPLASSQLASNYARYLNDESLSDVSAGAVSASPIPESNVIRVEGRAGSESEAVALADRAATTLQSRVERVSGGSDKQLLAKYSAASKAAAQAQLDLESAQRRLAGLIADDATGSRLDRARKQSVAASEDASTAQLRKDSLGVQYQNVVSSGSAAEVSLIKKAEITASDKVGKAERFGVLGLVLGLAVALVVVTLAERRGSRKA